MDTRDAGRLGGDARAESLTAQERSDSASHAARARWGTIKRAKRLKARVRGRVAAESRKANRHD